MTTFTAYADGTFSVDFWGTEERMSRKLLLLSKGGFVRIVRHRVLLKTTYQWALYHIAGWNACDDTYTLHLVAKGER